VSHQGRDDAKRVAVGRIVGVHGVQGWVKVESWTDPRDNLFGFEQWQLDRDGEVVGEVRLIEGRPGGRGLIAALEDVVDREQARALMGARISVPRSALPPPAEGEYYWVDLEGLAVVTTDGTELGTVSHLFETGANDVMVVRGDRERLIPFVPETYVRVVDVEAGRLEVDWDPAF
jgi:16S rRNA processing protein RimM